MNVPVLVGGLIFVGTLVGAAVAAAIVISLLIVSQMHKRWPMSRLLGLSHIVFLPVLPLQFVEVSNISSQGAFEVWLIYSFALMSISVLIDIFDLIRYASGRSSTYTD